MGGNKCWEGLTNALLHQDGTEENTKGVQGGAVAAHLWLSID